MPRVTLTTTELSYHDSLISCLQDNAAYTGGFSPVLDPVAGVRGDVGLRTIRDIQPGSSVDPDCARGEPHGRFLRAGEAVQGRQRDHVVLSFGSTAQLAQQAENGAPFDMFAAADTEHVDELVKKGVLLPASRAVYARGRLALWMPSDSSGVQALSDLTKPGIRTISIATPSLAPYGEVAVKSLQASGVWPQVKGKVVYANNVKMAKQFAASGNADAAFTAYSLVLHEQGKVLLVDEHLHKKLDQALGILKSSQHLEAAQRFRQFVLTDEGRSILERHGYDSP